MRSLRLRVIFCYTLKNYDSFLSLPSPQCVWVYFRVIVHACEEIIGCTVLLMVIVMHVLSPKGNRQSARHFPLQLDYTDHNIRRHTRSLHTQDAEIFTWRSDTLPLTSRNSHMRPKFHQKKSKVLSALCFKLQLYISFRRWALYLNIVVEHGKYLCIFYEYLWLEYS